MNSRSTHGLQVNRVPALHGWRWLRYGFAILMRSPAQLLLLMAMMMMLTNLLASFGLIGVVVAKGLMPVLLVSYLSLLHRLAPDAASLGTTPGSAAPGAIGSAHDARPAHTGQAAGKPRIPLDSVFSWARDRKALGAVIQLGMVSLTIDVIAIYLSGYPAAMEQLIEGVNRMAGQSAPQEEAMINLMAPVMRSALLMLSITIPCYLLMWYAPIFAGIHRRGLLKSLIFSVIAVFRNLPAFLCHAICLAAFVMLMAMLMTMLPGGGGAGLGADMLFSPYMLLIVPIVFSVIVCSQWACYLDTVTLSPETDRAPAALPPTEDGQG